jgi:anti-sigma factor RsiW
MPHPDVLRVQAYFDGEIDVVSAADIEQHMNECPHCQSVLEDLTLTQTALRKNLTDFRASATLRAKLNRALDRESGVAHSHEPGPSSRIWSAWSFLLGGLSGSAVAAAAAAVFAFMVWMPRAEVITGSLVSAHVRALMSAHSVDVVSTDRHTVKPWFAGHADVSPDVADFESEGYRLIGGRADYLDHQRVAVMVYQHGAHSIDVFSWAAPSRSLPTSATRDGYHVDCWKTGDLDYCAVSDTGWDELRNLERLMRNLSAHDQP